MDIEHLKYPIGRFHDPDRIGEEEIQQSITYLEEFPLLLRKKVETLSRQQLDMHYRPGGWKIKEVVHHIADSHMNALIRFKLALTEENPTIKPYMEGLWTSLADYQLPVLSSLQMIELIHSKWSTILKGMNEEAFERTYFHPESNMNISLKRACLEYAWHSKHHLAHISLPELNHQNH